MKSDIDTKILDQRIDAAIARRGGSGDMGGLEARIAKLEAAVEHIESDIGDIKLDIREGWSQARTDFRLQFGAFIFVALGLASMMAKGFHWLGG